MPPKRRFRRRRRRTNRKPYKKWPKRPLTKYRKPYSSVVSTRAPLPNKLSNMLRYTDYLQINNANTPYVEYDWRIDSLYDLDATGTGLQAPVRDILFTLYQQAVVHRASAQFRIQNKTNRAMRCFLWVDTTTTSYDPQGYDLRSHPGFLKTFDIGLTGNASGTNKTNVSLSLYQVSKRLLTDNASFSAWLGEAEHQNSSTASPATSLYLRMSFQAFDDDAASSMTFNVAADFQQSVIWARPITSDFIAYD